MRKRRLELGHDNNNNSVNLGNNFNTNKALKGLRSISPLYSNRKDLSLVEK